MPSSLAQVVTSKKNHQAYVAAHEHFPQFVGDGHPAIHVDVMTLVDVVVLVPHDFLGRWRETYADFTGKNVNRGETRQLYEIFLRPYALWQQFHTIQLLYNSKHH